MRSKIKNKWIINMKGLLWIKVNPQKYRYRFYESHNRVYKFREFNYIDFPEDYKYLRNAFRDNVPDYLWESDQHWITGTVDLKLLRIDELEKYAKKAGTDLSTIISSSKSFSEEVIAEIIWTDKHLMYAKQKSRKEY